MGAQASAQADTGLIQRVKQLQKQFQQLQERVSELEKQANESSNAEVEADADVESENERQGLQARHVTKTIWERRYQQKPGQETGKELWQPSQDG